MGVCFIGSVTPTSLSITDIDLLNSYLGTIDNILYHDKSFCRLPSIQQQLIRVSSMLYTTSIELETIEKYVADLIFDIELLTTNVTDFVVPHGSLHYARALAYRCAQSAFVIPCYIISKYLSYLSHYLFVLSIYQTTMS